MSSPTASPSEGRSDGLQLLYAAIRYCDGLGKCDDGNCIRKTNNLYHIGKDYEDVIRIHQEESRRDGRKIEDLREQIDEGESSLCKAQEMLRDKETELADLRTELRERNKEFASWIQRVAALLKSMTTTSQREKTLAAMKDNLERENTALMQKLDLANASHYSTEKKLEEANMKLLATEKKLSKERNKSSNGRKESRKALDSFTAKVAETLSIEKTSSDRLKVIDEQKKKIEDKDGWIASLEKQIKELTTNENEKPTPKQCRSKDDHQRQLEKVTTGRDEATRALSEKYSRCQQQEAKFNEVRIMHKAQSDRRFDVVSEARERQDQFEADAIERHHKFVSDIMERQRQFECDAMERQRQFELATDQEVQVLTQGMEELSNEQESLSD